MKRQHRRTPFVKLRKSSRTRNNIGFDEQFSNTKSAIIGYLTGKGFTSIRIAKLLDDGTKAATIRKMWERWNLPTNHTAGRSMEAISVPMAARERELVCKSAEKIGITPEEFIRKVAYYTARDDMFNAVVDDRS